LVIGLSGGVAASAWFVLARRGPLRRITLGLAAATAALAPLGIPPQARIARFIASLAAVILLVKLGDLALGERLERRPSFASFALWLTNIYSLVYRKRNDEPRPSAPRDLARLTLGGLLAAAGIAVGVACWSGPWPNFALEHSAKACLLLGTTWALSAVGAAITRLSGQPARELMLAPVLARTPADFWRRYNRPVNQWLHVHAFLPVGGRRAPVAAILFAFFVSGLIHEYLFAIPLGRVCGHQMAFFLLQGAAVAATARRRPRRAWAVLGVAGTLTFLLASSVLFFASLSGVFRFYERPLPGWLGCGCR
jgi:hypothetical protein